MALVVLFGMIHPGVLLPEFHDDPPKEVDHGAVEVAEVCHQPTEALLHVVPSLEVCTPKRSYMVDVVCSN